MIDAIDHATRASLLLALDAASLRQQAIAANIANAGSVGYVRQRVSFEDQLQQAQRSLADDGSVALSSLSGLAPRMVSVTHAGGMPEPVQLDAEMADLARNTVHYQALLKALSRHYAILSTAVSDGKR
ncbi:flagellar basal-body rod protein FlgB [Duganella sacchari]|uniref:Flagellar basal body rod protein FlgB n=1 Tax=Duganella sacchari TaxID=551987 RepID=A0A1M7PLK0_9BURK|nr:flagellar basal body protein [Duganella sacchari]SHN18084.1 flagellar basal-body rod protein FlgB [Duganella sacchari]